MNSKTTFYSITVTLMFLLIASLWAQETNGHSPRPGRGKWQHLAFEQEGAGISKNPELARKINHLGSEGWELVDVETMIENGTTQKCVYYFKRPN